MKKPKYKTKKSTKRLVYCMSWEESERGWGQRPDGISLHKTEQDYEDYIAEYWDSMPDEVPDEYDRPATDDLDKVLISQKLFKQIKGNGLRLWQHEIPKEIQSQRTKGWVPMKGDTK
jgi:hypothetical protein